MPTKTKPWIKIIKPEIGQPSLKDNTADVDRLIKGIKKGLSAENVTIDFSLVKKVSNALRKFNYQINAILHENQNGWRLIDLIPSQDGNGIYGLSVDLGSSTVVVRLLDLASQETKDEISFGKFLS